MDLSWNFILHKVLNLVKFVNQAQRPIADRAFYKRLMEDNLAFVSRNIDIIHEWLENYENDKISKGSLNFDQLH
jgi:hypothetical protein